MKKTLYCSISLHGLGHLAMSAPVLNQLAARHPDVRMVVQCAANRDVLQRYLDFAFEHVELEADFGMQMRNALDVDADASHQCYLELHALWPERVGEMANIIATYEPDLVFCNIAYLVNAATAKLAIPTINLCSLNWADIYAGYCRDLPGAVQILQDMRRAYASASLFLMPEPGMPMPSIGNLQSIGPIARIGCNQRKTLLQQLGLNDNAELILVAHGGVDMPLHFEHWPQHEGRVYIVNGSDVIARDDVVGFESLNIPFIDLMCSCNAIIGKPGYGTFVEAACNRLPMLYTRRRDWPEEPALVEWLQQHANCHELSREDLLAGRIDTALERLQQQRRHAPVVPEGVEQTVQVLSEYL